MAERPGGRETSSRQPLFCFALCLCLLLATTPGLRVLCVGADGHVSVEMAFEECCDETGTPDAHEGGGACGECDDRPLRAPSVVAKERAGLDAAAPLTGHALPPTLSLGLSRGLEASRAPGPGPVSGAAEASLSSTVLRC